MNPLGCLVLFTYASLTAAAFGLLYVVFHMVFGGWVV